MYPPRSRTRRNNKHSSKRRRRTVWAWINVSLLLMISALLTYAFTSGNDSSGEPPPAAVAVTSPAPEQGETVPEASAAVLPSPEPSSTPEPSAEPAMEVSPSPPAVSASPSPERSVEPPEDPAPPQNTGSGLISGLPEDNTGKTVKLNFAGDVIFSGKAGQLLQQKGYAYSYAALNGMFKKDDLTVLNLETPITTGGVGAPNKQFVYKGEPEALDALKAAGVDAVNLANNHMLDQGEEGLLDTLKHLSKRDIPYVGGGADAAEAYSAKYFERQGIRIALLGFTRVMPETGWKAGTGKPGVASVYDSAEALKAIAAARKKADLVAVVVHWGKERTEQYDSVQQALGHSFIDAGADLVMGGHPHVLQGIEPYKGKWIAYSTGNFIFTRSSTEATWETAVFQAECSAGGHCSLKLSPMNAELAQPVPMNEVDGQLLLHRVESLSSGLVKIGSDGSVIQVTK
ncbi:CapA family protein [Paenibacillus sp. S150]|uniref:CapA family protein n=1 Tax=Paenibacillus sp. S150 TaxID=2749826 RepID=UPI001C56ECC2|nr:CapA family protein [Paenibacillus sp. S150]MBW4083204.1 CapA family protein [Paenibacillus sp. S150]